MERGLSLSIPSAEADGNRRKMIGIEGKRRAAWGSKAKATGMRCWWVCISIFHPSTDVDGNVSNGSAEDA